MKFLLTLSTITILLVGCDNQSMSGMEIEYTLNTTPIRDVCLHKAYFDDCMKGLPAGPKSAHYNDWGEVVEACSDTAYKMSFRQEKNVKDECKSGYN